MGSTGGAVVTHLVEVRDLVKHFPVHRGFLRRQVGAVRAVDGVTFQLREGETLGLVGESGSGKSTLGRLILGLEPLTSGAVSFRGTALSDLSPAELRAQRRHMQMIFQDPYASLNPRIPVGRAIAEPLRIHGVGSTEDRARRVAALLERVGLDPGAAPRYPHEFSGGQRQRVGIARALATQPRLIIADEAISALDVSIQAQIVNLLGDLEEEFGLTYLFIAHGLSMVRYISDRVAVMYLGKLVELGGREGVFERPMHPYTRALIASIPVPDPVREAARPRTTLEGDVPNPAAPPPGCRFHTRCPFATERCRTEEPEWRNAAAEGSADPHWVACHHAEELT